MIAPHTLANFQSLTKLIALIINYFYLQLDTSCKLAPAGGYHDHEIGHKFDRTPHFNAWSESTGTSFKNNVHLYYE